MLINTKKFSKTTKLHESVFDRFTSALIYTKLHSKSCRYLLVLLMLTYEKLTTEVRQEGRNFGSANKNLYEKCNRFQPIRHA